MKAPSSIHKEIDQYWEDPTFREMIDLDLKAVKKHYTWLKGKREKQMCGVCNFDCDCSCCLDRTSSVCEECDSEFEVD